MEIPALEKLGQAQKFAFAHLPAVGGFPFLAECLRQAGVQKNTWWLPSAQSIYIMDTGNVVSQGKPLIEGMSEIPKFNEADLIAAIRTDQAGKSTFPEFLQAAWAAGIIRYDVDFHQRIVNYYGIHGENYQESYPSVEVRGMENSP